MTSEAIQTLIHKLNSISSDVVSDPTRPQLEVNELTKRAGKFYEKLRYLFDYKEEHTIRRSAVERQLKRQLAVGKRDSIGQNLAQELISGGYLPNKQLSEQTGAEIQRIIDRYMALDLYPPGSRIRKHLVSLAATEIDRHLKPDVTAEITLNCFFQTVTPQIHYENEISTHTFGEQIYIACRRSLLEEDEDMLFYALWLRHVPNWDSVDLSELARQVPTIFQELNDELKHPAGWQILPRLKNYKIYFLLIRKILERYGKESGNLFVDTSEIDSIISKILQEEYSNQYELAKKSGLRAIIYIFLTKILVAVALEFPAEIFLYGRVNYIALGSNVVIHPFLLFLMTRGLPKLKQEQISKATHGVKNVINGIDLEKLRVKKRSGNIFFDVLLLLLYLALFVFTFGIVVSILITAGFNIISILLFIAFLTLVSYFGFRIRHNAKKWRVTGTDRAISLLWRIFTLPIIRAGRWLSRTFSSINLFVFFLDFIIETPFKLVLGLLDAFVSFLREKEEEIY